MGRGVVQTRTARIGMIEPIVMECDFESLLLTGGTAAPHHLTAVKEMVVTYRYER